MVNHMNIKQILSRLQEIIPDCEYRDKSSYNQSPYICGYDSENEISIRIIFSPSGDLTQEQTNVKSLIMFNIECQGHERLRKNHMSPDDAVYECYFYILKELVESSNRFNDQINSFPKFTAEDNRNYKIDRIIS